MTPSFCLAFTLARQMGVGGVAVVGTALAAVALVLASRRSLWPGVLVLQLGALLACAEVLSLSFPGVAGGWSVAVAGIGFLAAVQALVLSWRARRLTEYAAAGRSGPDGSPAWWSEFERSFWAYVAKSERVRPPRAPGAPRAGEGDDVTDRGGW
jgi:hypothetical protein